MTSRSKPQFEKWPSIPRLRGTFYCTITEKIDGTNAQILITDDGQVQAGSRNRWITPDDDNFGFAAWVEENKTDLLEDLGPGRHFGEWWGSGIQRRYGVEGRAFSLFNVGRWAAREPYFKICKVVPVLYKGRYSHEAVEETKEALRLSGSKAAPGFMDPEGIVVEMAGALAKWTFGGDGHKGAA